MAAGAADIGIVPAFELTRQNLAVVPGVGIASRGAVRSILLISKCPATKIRTLAGDTSSRTSVALARIVLANKFGTTPQFCRVAPELETMLADADAALIIGDPALRLDPATLPYHVYDLGQEWTEWSGPAYGLRGVGRAGGRDCAGNHSGLSGIRPLSDASIWKTSWRLSRSSADFLPIWCAAI